MAIPWKNRTQIEAAFARMAAPRRLAMAAELLDWTVSNFSTPIADPVTRDLSRRSAAAIRTAVESGAAITPAAADPGLLEEADEVMQEPTEPGSFDLLLGYYLCFDELAPEITPERLTTIFDHCYEADYRRYSEPAIAVGEDVATDRGRAILEHQRRLAQRYTD